MTNDDVVEALGANEIFGVLDLHTRTVLARHADVRRYKKGEMVIVQDEPGDRMFMVASGGVRVIRRSGDGNIVELTRKTPGQIFGELALLDNGPRSASVETTSNTVLIAFSQEVFIGILEREPETVKPLFRVLGRMVREVATLTADIVLLDIKARLASRLLILAKEGDGYVDLVHKRRIPQAELGQMLGVTRQTVNSMLKLLQDEGAIDSTVEGIRILSIPKLKEISRGPND